MCVDHHWGASLVCDIVVISNLVEAMVYYWILRELMVVVAHQIPSRRQSEILWGMWQLTIEIIRTALTKIWRKALLE